MVTLSQASLQAIESWVAARVAADGTPGLSLAITDRDGLLHATAFGRANLESGEPLRVDHLIEIGSIGKSFTSIALLQLAEEGKIDLQAPVTDYLPWFSVQSAFEPIRLHHLLSHTAGITSGIDFAPAGLVQVRELRHSRTSCAPGTYFHYSNLGYKVLGEVLATVEGDSYGPTIQRRILDRLGLVDSVPVITHAVRDRMPVGYNVLEDDRPWWPGRPLVPAPWFETDTADGCLAMTAADLAGYLRMLLNRGEGVLSATGFDLLTQRAIDIPGASDPTWYGYGVVTRDVRGHTYVGHGGGMVGYFAGMIGDLDTGIGVTALVNGPGSAWIISRAVLDYVRALVEGEPASFPEQERPFEIANAESLAGDYVAIEGAHGPARIAIRAAGPGAEITVESSTHALRSWADDWFVSEAPELALFPLVAKRGDDGSVHELHYGNTVYRTGDAAPATVEIPDEWRAFAGHYRSHNPWTTGFRVFTRQGKLWLSVASEPDGLDYEQEMAPIGDGWFRVGADERIPEYARFSEVLNGQALVAHLSGCDFYRVNQR